MPRRKKKRVVDTVTSKAGYSIDIMFDPNADALDFSSDFGGLSISSRDANVVKKWAYKQLKTAPGLEWHKVIKVVMLMRHQYSATRTVGFSLDRFYYSTAHNGQLRQCSWPRPSTFDQDQKVDLVRSSTRFHWNNINGPFDPPMTIPGSFNRPETYLVYTEELWAGLKQLQDAIGQLRDRLNELISSQTGHEQIARVGRDLLKMLPAPKEE